MHPDISPYIYVIFTAATAIGVLMQACILLGMALGLRQFQKKLELVINHLTENAFPLIASSRVTLEEMGPKLKIISANLVEISETLKYESHNIRGSVDDVLERTRAQTARVDEMVSGTLDGISHASASIQRGIEVPIRQFSGLWNGLKAGLSVLREKPLHSAAKEDEVEPEIVVILEGLEEEAPTPSYRTTGPVKRAGIDQSQRTRIL